MLIVILCIKFYPVKPKIWLLVNKASRGGHYTFNFDSVLRHQMIVSPFKEKRKLKQKLNTLVRG